MPAINLTNGQTAIIFSKEEISERTNRSISRAFLKAASTAAKLTNLGFDDKDPGTWGVFSEISDDDQANLDGYQAVLIAGMVKSWSLGDLPTAETVVDLNKATFDELAAACGEEYNKTVDLSPDTDPKAPIAD